MKAGKRSMPNWAWRSRASLYSFVASAPRMGAMGLKAMWAPLGTQFTQASSWMSGTVFMR
jgi:hypothetical protein